MQKITIILSLILVIFTGEIYSQNAPITAAPNISSCVDISIDIPITVSDFFNIGAVSLIMNYDNTVLTYESYTNNSGFPGLIINGTIPGTIIAGGYINPGDQGILLVDNSVLFTLTFQYLGGYTDLTWYDNGESCEYTNDIYFPLNDLPNSTYYINGSVSPIEPVNAPITDISNITICPDTYVDIPITVSDFCKIGAISLTMNYNASTLIYQSFINNSGFPGLVINEPIPGTIIAGGYINPGHPGISLPDNAVLFTLIFHNIGGSTDLTWYDDGESCEYTDNLFNPLDDSPSTSYYIDGSVTPFQPLNAPVTTAPHIIAYSGTIIEVPVTVSDFCKIGALSLTMNYNPAVLLFQSYTNNSGFPGLTLNGSIPGSVIAGAYLNPGDPGFSMHDNSVLFTLCFLYMGGSTGLNWYDNGESCEYTDNLFNPLPDSPTSSYYFNGSVNGSVNLDLKVFLEGPFQNNEMNTTLNDFDFIPLTQQYFGYPWFYYGTESVVAIPNSDVVDWILVELRQTIGDPSTAVPNTKTSQQSGFLLSNGKIVGLDGTSKLTFNVIHNTNLFAIIWHRNHLGIMSAIPLLQTGNTLYHDFTTSANQAYLSGQKSLSEDNYVMYAGNANGDMEINISDINVWAIDAAKKGYFSGDMDLNIQVYNQDKNDIWYDNNGQSSQVPE